MADQQLFWAIRGGGGYDEKSKTQMMSACRRVLTEGAGKKKKAKPEATVTWNQQRKARSDDTGSPAN